MAHVPRSYYAACTGASRHNHHVSAMPDAGLVFEHGMWTACGLHSYVVTRPDVIRALLASAELQARLASKMGLGRRRRQTPRVSLAWSTLHATSRSPMVIPFGCASSSLTGSTRLVAPQQLAGTAVPSIGATTQQVLQWADTHAKACKKQSLMDGVKAARAMADTFGIDGRRLYARSPTWLKGVLPGSILEAWMVLQGEWQLAINGKSVSSLSVRCCACFVAGWLAELSRLRSPPFLLHRCPTYTLPSCTQSTTHVIVLLLLIIAWCTDTDA